jgi:DNA polymerase
LPLINQSEAGINGQSAGGVSVLAAQDLGMLLENPRRKAGFWRSWLGWADHD